MILGEERRYKILRVDERSIVSCFEWMQRPLDNVVVPDDPIDLPVDASVRRVNYEIRCLAFDIVLWSSEWPISPDGAELEVMNDGISRWRMVSTVSSG